LTPFSEFGKTLEDFELGKTSVRLLVRPLITVPVGIATPYNTHDRMIITAQLSGTMAMTAAFEQNHHLGNIKRQSNGYHTTRQTMQNTPQFFRQ
jgi:hypothetical protein